MRNFSKMRKIFGNKKAYSKGRIAVWCAVLVVCLLFSGLVWRQAGNLYHEFKLERSFQTGEQVYELTPGSTMEQIFTAQGKSAGGISCFYLQMYRDAASSGTLQMRVYEVDADKVMLDSVQDFSKILTREEASAIWEQVQEQEELSADGWHQLVDSSNFYLLKSGQRYCIEIVNQSETDSVYILGNHTIQSGKLLLNGERQTGILNLCFIRQSFYSPSILLLMMILVTDITVLLGLWLVLFTQVKTEVLYLVLAMGFGLVMLFDLTPIYGFDMRFQFDSTYVLSNRMLGMEDVVYTPSMADPQVQTLSYYRRVCDDYSQYQFYQIDEVSANYSDMKAGLRYPFATEAMQELELVETDLGFVETQLYLCLPQAIGFSLARILGLGMQPMLQMGRLFSYAVFVLCAFLAIHEVPFGKRLMMILALMPAMLTQMISISRDGLIISFSFLLIALVLKMHYEEKKPRWYQWLVVLGLSALLAPCKMVYVPVSCLCLMTVYKRYMRHTGKKGVRIALFTGAIFVIGAGMFIAEHFDMIMSILFEVGVSLYNTPAYSLGIMLSDPMHTLYVFGNTLRNQMGTLLINAVQLFDIDLGSSDGITLIVFMLLLLETFSVDTDYKPHIAERCYMLLLSAGVFLLLVLAAFLWTPLEMDVFIGFQGRYLIPILPMLLLAFYNNKIFRIDAAAEIMTKVTCCVFPAISLMNMYLWTIMQ